MLFRGDDARRLAQLDNLAAEMRVRFVATNDVHYHVPERRALQDVVTAIRLGCTVDELGFRRFASAERHLKEPQEMARLFRRHPRAIERTQEIVETLQLLAPAAHLSVSDRLRRRRDPDGQAHPSHLGGRGVALSRTVFRTRWPIRSGTSSNSSRSKGIAPYFLTVHEIVAEGPRTRAFSARVAVRPPTPLSATASASPR